MTTAYNHGVFYWRHALKTKLHKIFDNEVDNLLGIVD
jgi:hypothetical protein